MASAGRKPPAWLAKRFDPGEQGLGVGRPQIGAFGALELLRGGADLPGQPAAFRRFGQEARIACRQGFEHGVDPGQVVELGGAADDHHRLGPQGGAALAAVRVDQQFDLALRFIRGGTMESGQQPVGQRQREMDARVGEERMRGIPFGRLFPLEERGQMPGKVEEPEVEDREFAGEARPEQHPELPVRGDQATGQAAEREAQDGSAPAGDLDSRNTPGQIAGEIAVGDHGDADGDAEDRAENDPDGDGIRRPESHLADDADAGADADPESDAGSEAEDRPESYADDDTADQAPDQGAHRGARIVPKLQLLESQDQPQGQQQHCQRERLEAAEPGRGPEPHEGRHAKRAADQQAARVVVGPRRRAAHQAQLEAFQQEPPPGHDRQRHVGQEMQGQRQEERPVAGRGRR